MEEPGRVPWNKEPWSLWVLLPGWRCGWSGTRVRQVRQCPSVPSMLPFLAQSAPPCPMEQGRPWQTDASEALLGGAGGEVLAADSQP